MPSRIQRFQNFILSPGISLIVGVVGAMLMLGHWWVLAASVIMVASMTSQIKALTLFRGRNYPFIGLFMLLQAALMPNLIGAIIGIIALFALILILRSFSSPENTRTIFFIYLMCGAGALFSRSFAFLALLLMACIILVRAFSWRGLMAAFLGFITPAILIIPMNLEMIAGIKIIYTRWLISGYTIPILIVAAITFLAGILTFLPSYGYPGQTRARNMAMLGFAAGAIALPLIDSCHAPAYFAILNLSCAYLITHLAAQKRPSWPYIIMAWIACIITYYEYCC